MKKLVSFLLVVIMVLSLGVTAFAAGSPTKDETSSTTTAATTPTYKKGMGLFNSDDEKYATVPANAVKKTAVANANKLADEDKEAFLAAYEDAKKVEGKVVKYFYWLDIPEQYKTDEFAYAEYIFTSTGKNIQVTVNGKEMEVEQIGKFTYSAKLTEFGAVAILCD